jgi:hypothetical protein
LSWYYKSLRIVKGEIGRTIQGSASEVKVMEKEVREKIEEIIAGMNCPKDFKCAQHGFERLCKAGEYRIEGYLLPRDEEKEQADGGSRLNSFARCNI